MKNSKPKKREQKIRADEKNFFLIENRRERTIRILNMENVNLINFQIWQAAAFIRPKANQKQYR